MSEKHFTKDCSSKFAAKYLIGLECLMRTFAWESPHLANLYDQKGFSDQLWIEILRRQAQQESGILGCFHRQRLRRRLGEHYSEQTVANFNLADNLVLTLSALRQWRSMAYQRRHYDEEYTKRIDHNRHATRDYLESGDTEFTNLVNAGRACNDIHLTMEQLASDIISDLDKFAQGLLKLAYVDKIPREIESSFCLVGEYQTALDDLADLRNRCQPCRDIGVDSYPYQAEMLIYYALLGDEKRRGWYDLHTDAIVAHERYTAAIKEVDAAIDDTY